MCFGRLGDVAPGYGVVSVNFRGPGARPSWQAVNQVELSAWRVVFGLSGLSDSSAESVCSVMSHGWDSMWWGHGTPAQSDPSRPFKERVTETRGQTLCLYRFHIINTENLNSGVVLRERNRLGTMAKLALEGLTTSCMQVMGIMDTDHSVCGEVVAWQQYDLKYVFKCLWGEVCKDLGSLNQGRYYLYFYIALNYETSIPTLEVRIPFLYFNGVHEWMKLTTREETSIITLFKYTFHVIKIND